MKLFRKKRMLDSVQAHIDNIKHYREENPAIFVGCHSTDAQVALNCLKDVLLGEDWYVVDPLSVEQCNTLILDEILYLHYKPYKNFARNYRKEEKTWSLRF